MKRIAVALMLASAAVGADPWKTVDALAVKDNGTNVDVAVAFVETAPQICDAAALVIVGNNDINTIGFCTDKQCYSSSPVHGSIPMDGIPNVYMHLTDGALAALMDDHVADIETDQGKVTITLAGSKKAMLQAHNNCVRQSTPVVLPELKKQPREAEPADSQDQFRIYKDGVML